MTKTEQNYPNDNLKLVMSMIEVGFYSICFNFGKIISSRYYKIILLKTEIR